MNVGASIQIPAIESFPVALDIMSKNLHRIYYTCIDTPSKGPIYCERGRKVFETIPFTHKHVCAFAVKGATASEYSKHIDAHFENTHSNHKVVKCITTEHFSTTPSTQ